MKELSLGITSKAEHQEATGEHPAYHPTYDILHILHMTPTRDALSEMYPAKSLAACS